MALPTSSSIRAPRPTAAAEAGNAELAPSTIDGEKLDTYNVIVAKHLFNPARSESGAGTAAAAGAPPPVKPALHGVVVDGDASLAYLEDPTTNRVLMYRIGDSIAGGQLVNITGDRVQIRRVDGSIDVLLNDPSKPKGATPAARPAVATPGPPSRRTEVGETGSPQRSEVIQRPVRTPRAPPETQ